MRRGGQALGLEASSACNAWLFLNVPASGKESDGTLVADGNVLPATIVRLGTIPHGVSALMQGLAPSATPTVGPPQIPEIYPIPELTAFVPDPAPSNAGRGIQPANLGPYTATNPPSMRCPKSSRTMVRARRATVRTTPQRGSIRCCFSGPWTIPTSS
jgi:hypothetical protein